MRRVCTALVQQMAQHNALLGSMPAEAYARRCAIVGGATVGQHVRHTFDHMERVASLAHADQVDEVLRYDARQRETEVETSVEAAIECASKLSSSFASLAAKSFANEGFAQQELRVSFDVPDAAVEAQAKEVVFTSTIRREAMFALHHAFHHDAMIAVIANAQPEWGIVVPDGFGIAPSTKSFLGERGAKKEE